MATILAKRTEALESEKCCDEGSGNRDEGSGNKEGSESRKGSGFSGKGYAHECEGCGEEFSISHDPVFVDKWLAEKQAHWLEKVLAEEHERDKKHADRIELPG